MIEANLHKKTLNKSEIDSLAEKRRSDILKVLLDIRNSLLSLSSFPKIKSSKISQNIDTDIESMILKIDHLYSVYRIAPKETFLFLIDLYNVKMEYIEDPLNPQIAII